MSRRIPQSFSAPVSKRLTYFRPTIWIRKLDVSRVIKTILYKVRDFTVRFANRTLKVGKKLLELIAHFADRYPQTSFTLIASIGFAWFIGNVPVLGAILKPFVVPIIAWSAGAAFAKEHSMIRSFEKSLRFLNGIA